MAKDKDTSFEAQLDQEAKEAKKKLKNAEKAKPDKEKKDKAEKKVKSRKARKFIKDFRGELKKIVWPDFKTVMKNTGIVLLTVVIIGAMVWILDFGLSQGIGALKKLAEGVQALQESEVPEPLEETTTVDASDLVPTTAAETTAEAQ